MAFEAYSVAVKLSLINHVSAGMLLISKSLAATGQDADALNAKLASIGKQGAIGAAMFAGGLGLAALFKAPIDAARQYELALTRFKTLNLGDSINDQADKFARSANILGVTSKDLIDTFRESYGMIGNIDLAKQIAPTIASLNAANSALFGGKIGSIDKGATRSIMRFIDMRGLTNTPEDMKRGLDIAQKMITGSGGALKFSDLEQFAKRGGAAFKGMSDEGLIMMATVMQEMGGASAGTGYMSAYQNLVAGRTTKKSMAALQELGLAELGYKDHGEIGGKKYKTLQVTSMQDEKTLRENFPLWVMNNVIPALEKRGITDIAEQAAKVNSILSNRTGSNLGVSFTTQSLQTMRDANMVKRAMGVDQTIQAYKDDPNSKFADLGAKWNGLMVNLGIVVLPFVISALEKIIPKLVEFSAWVDKNPDTIKKFTIALIGLSVFLIGGGLINMIIAAGRGFFLLGKAMIFLGGRALAPLIPWVARLGTYLVMFAMSIGKAVMFLGRALLMTPVGLVITAIAAAAFLLWNNWSEISGALKLMWSDMKTGFIQLFHGDIGGAFKSFALVFLTGWQTIFNTLIAGANAILPASMQISKTTFADDYRNSGRPKEPWSPMVAPVPGKQSGGGEQNINLYLDGKKLTDVVIQRAAKEAMRPRTGTQGFDPTRSMLMPGTPSTALPRG
ncbi:hypothetical protein [Pseudomonas veronii]|uniref:Phage tail tape measure protein n=1 Tax=Pseudomonas veronii TaxID=76761 RepID=A0A4P7YA77_PSEVE|nr:hypothetical protein [Pseudomonas veronii]QCG67348.1 hypothetical protein E4167_23530 [Pseudomonas veronii]